MSCYPKNLFVYPRQKILTRAIMTALMVGSTFLLAIIQAATIQGTVFSDLNSNGTRESCESI